MESMGGIEWIPRIGMDFETTEAAWEFWNKYAGKIGFSARKSYNNLSILDGKTTSRAFVCSNHGYKCKDKRDDEVKRPRQETRTGCLVRLALKLNRKTNKYVVDDFINEHNHILQRPHACYMLPSQRKVTKVAAAYIDLADDSGIRPKATHEFMSRQVGGIGNVGHTLIDQRNYLRDKRQDTLVHGEAVSILRYFCQHVKDNPSFQHAEQIDDQQEISNIFWADAQMVIDYAHFGEVIIFDTTHGTNKEYRPFGVFVGFNHFRETVIFGAVLLYDQSIDSFKWVFDTFLKAHNNKQPKTIFTDQDAAMGIAIASVMPNVTHGLCCWHIMENAARHLMSYNKRDLDYVGRFRACVFVIEEKDEFEKAFSDLVSELGDIWLSFVYKEKHKWAYCYMRSVLSLGARSTQMSESLNKDLKNYLKSDMDLVRFFQHFERVVADKREKEVGSEYGSIRKVPRIKMNVPILLQMSKRYTPKVFEISQEEYELSMATQIQGPVENEFIVSTCDMDKVSPKCSRVSWNPITETVLCNCKKFEKWGILCSHALKVLDTMNIKLLPEKYVLERWTYEARQGMVCDKNGITVVDRKLDVTRRHRDLCMQLIKLVAKGSESEEITTYLQKLFDEADKEVNKMLLRVPNSSIRNCKDSLTTDSMDEFSQNPLRLKKRNGKKGSKRNRSWNEDLPKNNTRKPKGKQPAKQNTTKSNMGLIVAEKISGTEDSVSMIPSTHIFKDVDGLT